MFNVQPPIAIAPDIQPQTRPMTEAEMDALTVFKQRIAEVDCGALAVLRDELLTKQEAAATKAQFD